MSSRQLSTDQTATLQMGLNFIPEPNMDYRTIDEYLQCSTNFIRTLKIQLYFDRQENKTASTTPTDNHGHAYTTTGQWIPPEPSDPDIISYITDVHKQIQTHFSNYNEDTQKPRNMTTNEFQTLQQLSNLQDITIKPADKGGAIVILDTTEYIDKVLDLLTDTNHYQPTEHDMTKDTAAEVRLLIQYLHTTHKIDKRTAKRLLPPDTPRTPLFYGLPKIHKDNTPLRPIVSGNDSPTENLSIYIDEKLQPLARALPSYIRDTTDFLRQTLSLPPLPPNAILVTMDVKSLYTNIPHFEGTQTVIEHIKEHGRTTPHFDNSLNTQIVHTFLTLILTTNMFQFLDKYYLQIFGTAMGTRCAVSYANIFMHQRDKEILHLLRHLIIYYKRYIDDIFFIFLGTAQELRSHFSTINGLHPTIKYSMDHSLTHIDFLDPTIYIGQDRKLYSSLYKKPADTDALLHYRSYHPDTTKRSIVYTQALRYRRLITKDEQLQTELQKLRTTLTARGYLKTIIDKGFARIKTLTQHDLLFPTNRSQANYSLTHAQRPRILPFIIPYHKKHKQIRDILLQRAQTDKRNNHHINTCLQSLVLAYKRNTNLKDLLVHTRQHQA